MAKTILPCTCSPLALVFIAVFLQQWLAGCGGSNFNDEFNILWGGGRGQISGDGTILNLTMDSASGSGFRSKNVFLFGKVDMEIKLIPGNSAGTVTTYYLSSEGPTHDEIDFEFLGNVSGDPYTIHTNIYTQGKGEREQQFRLWFDPTSDFHTYSMIWTPQTIIFTVDDTPIREFKNLESVGVPFPNKQPMMLYSSLFCGDQWATRGGLVKTDWSHAPFTASYRNFNAIGGESLRANFLNRNKLNWVRKNLMIYNYCTDTKRFPQGFPPECKTDGSV